MLWLLLLFVFALHPDHKFEYMVPRQTTPHLQKYINITIGILHVIFYGLCHKYSNTYKYKTYSMVFNKYYLIYMYRNLKIKTISNFLVYLLFKINSSWLTFVTKYLSLGLIIQKIINQDIRENEMKIPINFKIIF